MTIFAAGNILFGHFEERTPKWRRLLKVVLVTGVAVGISAWLGRPWFWAFMGVMLLAFLYVHAWVLPRKGINGLTGEPKERYYALRGWNTGPRP
jgi:biotin transporter BioY